MIVYANIRQRIKELKDITNYYSIWELALVLAFILAMPLRAYFYTSFIIEVSAILMILFLPFRKKNESLANSSDYYHLFFLLVLFVLGIALGTTDSPFFTESYRYFTFFIFLTILKSFKLNYDNLVRLCFWVAVFCSFFSIFELVYLNIISIGNYYDIPIIGRASSGMYVNESSDYLAPQWFLGLPYFRPMGFFIQPQKSGFIPVIGTICHYLLIDRKSSKKRYVFWYVFFTLIVIASAAKTAIVTQLLIIFVGVFNLYPRKNLTQKEVIQIICVTVPLLVFAIYRLFGENHAAETSYILNDLLAFFNFPYYNWIIGVGIPDYTTLLLYGFSCECYLARLLAQVGLILFVIELLWGYSLICSKSKKINWILIILLFGLFSHYCVLNAYFVTFSLATIVCFVRSKSKEELE